MSNICSIFLIPLSSSLSAFVWKMIYFLWSWYGFWILIGLIAWTIFELFTRNGSLHYNSANGFSPAFNIFVGSGAYWGTQSLLLILLAKIFGEIVYCLMWPYIIHLIVFISVSLFLNVTGFWVYFKFSGKKRLGRRFRKRRYR